MKALRTCPSGHQWHAADDDPAACPVCSPGPGAALTVSIGSTPVVSEDAAARAPSDGLNTVYESALSPELDEQLQDAILAYQQAVEAGTVPERDAFLRRYPGLTAQLERFLAEEQQIAPLLSPLRGLGGTAPPMPPADSFGDYEILDTIARGGMGVVYRARQKRLGRVVAVKMVLAGIHTSPAELERFRVEAQAIARLQHPNIVQVHDVGEHNGLPFFSLEYCAGGSLAQKLAGAPLPPQDAAGLVETLARAMHAVHEKDIIHRDLKPGNVLLAEDGTPKVTDFGLARKVDEAGMTATGAIMGTPSYMAPEQAQGRIKELGPACDVYALGAILYECLTGRPPFKAATALDTVAQVVRDEPVPPRQLNAGVPVDVETICLTCLRKEPGRRYAAAKALAEDLRRFRAGEPILARPVGRLERARKWARRNPAVATLLSLLAVAFVAALGLTGWAVAEADRADGEAKKAQDSERRAIVAALDLKKAIEDEKEAREHAEDLLATSTMMLARSRFEEGQTPLADELLEQIPSKFRFSAWGFLKNYVGGSLFTLRGHTSVVKSVAFAADGQILASAGYDWTVKLWDARTGQELRTLRGHRGSVRSVAFAADGQMLASASDDGTVKLWDARTGQELRTLRGHRGSVRSVAFAADGQMLASASDDGTVKLWDARTGQELRTLRGHTNWVTSVAFADGQILASASYDMTVKLWDVRTGQELRTLRGHTNWVTSVAFADGQILASASSDRTVKLWDVRTGHELRTLRGHTGIVTSVAFAADGQMLASASDDGTVKLWDARTGQELRTLRGHTNWVTSVAFADGQILASASYDMTVKLWDVRTGHELRTLRGHTGIVTSVAFAADGQILASAGYDWTVKLWDVRTGHELRTLRGHTGIVASVAFAADGQILASASSDRTVKLWDVRTGHELRTLRGHTGIVTSVAFAADGQMLASASGDGTVKLWDARTGQELRTLRGHRGSVRSVAFAADGQMLASASDDGTVKLWDARTGQELRTLRGHRGSVRSVAFAADGQMLASASSEGTVKLWDVRTGHELRTLRGHTGIVTSVAFAADGQMLASASDDGTVKLWDARTGQELRTLRGHTNWVTSVAFADGQILASASSDRTVKLWDVRTGHELGTLRGHTGMVWSMTFAADGQILASASDDGTIKLWDVRTDQELRTLRGHTGVVASVAFAADGQMLASAGYDRTVKLWDARTGKELCTLRGHTGVVMSVAFSADGQMLASASGDGTVKLWDVRTGQELRTLRGHTSMVWRVAFSADGQMLASASGDGTVKLWDVRTGQELRTLRGHTSMVWRVAFAADGRVLASASVDGTVKLWDARTGQELRTLRGHTTIVTSVAFAADGKTLWSRDGSGIVLAWKIATGKRLIPDAPAVVRAFGYPRAWSPDGSIQAVGQSNGLILLVPRAISEKERRFRWWITAPDLHLHRERAEAADEAKQPLALAFRLGRYLAAQNYYAARPKEASALAGWLGTAAQPPGLLPGLPVAVKTPFHPPAFPDGIACTGVLYKDSGIDPKRLLIGTARAVQDDPTSWLTHAFHGGALYRSGAHAQARAALTRAAELHGKPSPLTHQFLVLTCVAMKQEDQARQYLKQARPAADAPWEDQYLDRLLQPEVDAALKMFQQR